MYRLAASKSVNISSMDGRVLDASGRVICPSTNLSAGHRLPARARATTGHDSCRDRVSLIRDSRDVPTRPSCQGALDQDPEHHHSQPGSFDMTDIMIERADRTTGVDASTKNIRFNITPARPPPTSILALVSVPISIMIDRADIPSGVDTNQVQPTSILALVSFPISIMIDRADRPSGVDASTKYICFNRLG
eukprot:gene8046-1280_t